MARSHSGPLTRQPDPDEVRVRTSLDSFRSKLDYHDKLREQRIDAKASVMKQHNEHVEKTKSDYEQQSVRLREQRFIRSVTKQIKIDKSVTSRLKEQNVYQTQLRTRNEDRSSKAMLNISEKDHQRTKRNRSLMQKLAAQTASVESLRVSRDHAILVKKHLDLLNEGAKNLNLSMYR